MAENKNPYASFILPEEKSPYAAFIEEEKPQPETTKGGLENFFNTFKDYIIDPALGAIQSTSNLPIGLANLPIKAINAMSSSHIPEIPYFDVAPHTRGAQFGEYASMLGGPGLLRGMGKVGENVISRLPNISQNPLIERGVENARNIFNKLPISKDTAKNIGTGALLGAGYEHENPILGAIGGASIPIAGKTFSLAKKALHKPDIEKIGASIQENHDSLGNYANDLFEKASEKAYERGIGNVPIDQKLIDKMEEFLPKTDAISSLIQNARSGDYASLRKAQSELWQRGTYRLKSAFPSERDRGEEIIDLRNRINKSIFNHFEKTGNEDLGNMLSEGMNSYRTLKDTYYGKKVPLAIKNMVHEESREIPKNLMNVISKQSRPLNKIREMNPSINEHIRSLAEKKNAIKKLKYLGGGAGVIGGSYLAPSLYGKAKQIGNILSE